MMNSNNEDYERYIDIIERTLSEKNISQPHFDIFQAALDNISKIYLEYTTSVFDIHYLINVINALKHFFQQDTNTGFYKSVIEKTERSRNNLAWLKGSYNWKRQTKNAGKILVSEDQVDAISLSNYTYPEGQSSLSVSIEDEKEKQTITLVKDKNDREVQFKQEHDNLNKGEERKVDNVGDTGDNHHFEAKAQFITSTVNSQLNDKEELQKGPKEIAGLKKEIESKNQVILDLNIQLMQQTTQNQSTKEHLNTVISKLETRTTDARTNKEELVKKTREIENINKEITDLRKQNITEISNRDMFQYKVNFLEQELQKKNDEGNTFLLNLTTKDDQLKKLELEIETLRNISVYETRQHQEKSKELQEFKSKSMELQNNLRTKGDELISKLRELSECKSELVKYANMNGSFNVQFSLLEKHCEELELKFEVDSTNYQKEITSLKEQLFTERNLNEQIESVKEQLKEQKESYNYLESSNMGLQSKFSKTVADLGEANATIQNLKDEINFTQNKNFELDQKLGRVNSQLELVNNQLLSTEEQNKIVSNKFSEAKSQVKKMQKTLEAMEQELKVCNDKFCEEKDNNNKFKIMFEFHLSKLNQNRNELKAFIDKLFTSQTIEEIREGERENVKKNALFQLDVIKTEVDGHRQGVRQFSGSKLSKTFLNLQEMIQRCIEKVDQIQSQDISEIKEKKKQLIKYCGMVDEDLQRKATSA